MKRNLSAGFAVIVAVAAIYFGLLPRSLPEREAALPHEPHPERTKAAEAEDSAGDDADEERHAAMAAAYAGLERVRRDLKRRLDGLKARLWRVELPARDAEFIERQLLHGYSLLKNPPLLGAFHDAQEISRERDRIQSALSRLDEVQKKIESVLSAPGPAPGGQ